MKKSYLKYYLVLFFAGVSTFLYASSVKEEMLPYVEVTPYELRTTSSSLEEALCWHEAFVSYLVGQATYDSISLPIHSEYTQQVWYETRELTEANRLKRTYISQSRWGERWKTLQRNLENQECHTTEEKIRKCFLLRIVKGINDSWNALYTRGCASHCVDSGRTYLKNLLSRCEDLFKKSSIDHSLPIRSCKERYGCYQNTHIKMLQGKYCYFYRMVLPAGRSLQPYNRLWRAIDEEGKHYLTNRALFREWGSYVKAFPDQGVAKAVRCLCYLKEKEKNATPFLYHEPQMSYLLCSTDHSFFSWFGCPVFLKQYMSSALYIIGTQSPLVSSALWQESKKNYKAAYRKITQGKIPSYLLSYIASFAEADINTALCGEKRGYDNFVYASLFEPFMKHIKRQSTADICHVQKIISTLPIPQKEEVEKKQKVHFGEGVARRIVPPYLSSWEQKEEERLRIREKSSLIKAFYEHYQMGRMLMNIPVESVKEEKVLLKGVQLVDAYLHTIKKVLLAPADATTQSASSGHDEYASRLEAVYKDLFDHAGLTQLIGSEALFISLLYDRYTLLNTQEYAHKDTHTAFVPPYVSSLWAATNASPVRMIWERRLKELQSISLYRKTILQVRRAFARFCSELISNFEVNTASGDNLPTVCLNEEAQGESGRYTALQNRYAFEEEVGKKSMFIVHALVEALIRWVKKVPSSMSLEEINAAAEAYQQLYWELCREYGAQRRGDRVVVVRLPEKKKKWRFYASPYQWWQHNEVTAATWHENAIHVEEQYRLESHFYEKSYELYTQLLASISLVHHEMKESWYRWIQDNEKVIEKGTPAPEEDNYFDYGSDEERLKRWRKLGHVSIEELEVLIGGKEGSRLRDRYLLQKTEEAVVTQKTLSQVLAEEFGIAPYSDKYMRESFIRYAQQEVGLVQGKEACRALITSEKGIKDCMNLFDPEKKLRENTAFREDMSVFYEWIKSDNDQVPNQTHYKKLIQKGINLAEYRAWKLFLDEEGEHYEKPHGLEDNNPDAPAARE